MSDFVNRIVYTIYSPAAPRWPPEQPLQLGPVDGAGGDGEGEV